jgi:FKBP-type peptidyl-prolyl cis-trans isomerase
MMKFGYKKIFDRVVGRFSSGLRGVSMEVFKRFSVFCGVGCFATSLFGASAEKQASDNAAPTAKEAASKKEAVADTKTYFKVLGWMNTMQSGVRSLDLSIDEQSVYMEGARLALEGKEAPTKLGDIMEPMQKFLKDRSAESEKKRMAEVKVIAAENRKKGEEFIKKTMEANKNLKKSASGLVYEITKVGGAVKANEEDSVEIYYKGSLIDGKVFDESKEKTVTFPLNGVIPGIKEGLQLLGEGGRAILYIPDNIGYGEYDIPGIPAGSTLVFDVEVVKVVKPMKSADAEKDTSEPAPTDKKTSDKASAK